MKKIKKIIFIGLLLGGFLFSNYSLAATTSTIATFDAHCEKNDATYLTAQTATNADLCNNTDAGGHNTSNRDTGAEYQVGRSFWNFNNLIESIDVSSATLKFRQNNASTDNDDGYTVAAYAYNGTSTETFITSDYSQCGTVALTSAAAFDDAADPIDFALSFNATGLSYLSGGSKTLCVRLNGDVNQSVPAGYSLLGIRPENNEVGAPQPNIIYDYEEAQPPVTSNINFIWPQHSTTTPDFKNWLIRFNPNSTSSKQYNILINYGLSPDNLNFWDRWPRFGGSFGVQGFLDLDVFVFKHITFFNSEIWYAQAFLTSQDGFSSTLEAETDLITFTIDNTKIIPIAAITTSTTSEAQQSAADKIVKILQGIIPSLDIEVGETLGDNSLDFCNSTSTAITDKFLMTLFCPTGTAKEFLANQFNSFQGQFPLSVLTAMLGAVSIPSSTINGAANLTIVSDFYGDITIIHSDTLKDFIGEDGKNSIFSAQSAIIWIIVSFSILGFVAKYLKK